MYSSSILKFGFSPSPLDGLFYLVDIPSRVTQSVHLDVKLEQLALVGESVLDKFLFIEF